LNIVLVFDGIMLVKTIANYQELIVIFCS